uniref:hypothetical protein n=1 Tax=Sphingomonas sp. NY01 TaxID=2968057 RepID=UPI00406CD868
MPVRFGIPSPATARRRDLRAGLEEHPAGARRLQLLPAPFQLLAAALGFGIGRNGSSRRVDPRHWYGLAAVLRVEDRAAAIVRRSDERYAEILQRREDRAPILQLPPPFDRPILIDPANYDGCVLWDQEACRQLRSGSDMDLAGGHIDQFIER